MQLRHFARSAFFSIALKASFSIHNFSMLMQHKAFFLSFRAVDVYGKVK